MKKIFLAGVLAGAIVSAGWAGDRLVILHTNDTHSQIDPRSDGQGGMLQLKAVMDSVERAEEHVLKVDAGDMVQGSLYFKFFKGDVEYPLFNMMGYDVRVLGNHEFDNGLEELARYYKDVKASRLSANYDFSKTGLKGVFQPYVVKKVGKHRVGFLGLNVNPHGLIIGENYAGMGFEDILEAANRTAKLLKQKEKCDVVVAVTHIGYSSEEPGAVTDLVLAAKSRDIDVIIGGHSHTLLDPSHPDPSKPTMVKNLDGKPVLIAQTGRYGRYLGKVEIDLANPSDKRSEVIAVTDRFPAEQLDRRMAEFIAPYRAKVDSVNHHVIARSAQAMRSDANVGAYPNWTADYARWWGDMVADSLELGRGRVDLGLMNVGGIRMDMPQGDVSEGLMLATFPFANRMVVLDISGADLLDVLQAAANKGGEGVSENVRVAVGPDGKVAAAIIDGKPLDPARRYLVSTIDYLAAGNDYLDSLAKAERVWTDSHEMADRVLRYVKTQTAWGLPLQADPNPRFIFNR